MAYQIYAPENSLHHLFLNKLYKKYNAKNNLVGDISEALNLDKAAVYRRLRGEVKFNVDELGILATRYEISVDQLLDNVSSDQYKVLKLSTPILHTGMGPDVDLLSEHTILYEKFTETPYTEMGAAINSLSPAFYMPFPELSKFMIFKWGHYYTSHESYRYYRTTEVPEKLMENFRASRDFFPDIKHSFHIYDENIIPNLVKDIKYFESLGYMTPDEVALLKEDIEKMVNGVEEIVALGRFRDTGNKAEFYVSSMSIDTSQAYLESVNGITFYLLNVFTIRQFMTTQLQYGQDLKQSLNRMKDGALMISGSAAKERKIFFNKQRETIALL